MKNLKFIIPVTLLLFFSIEAMAQDVPPNPPGTHGTDGDKAPGGGAPIGSGIAILIGLGAAYGGKKIYDLNKEKLEG
jgi:hypothetical protein